MGDLLIRDLDDATRAELKARAARHGRSLSAEARAILQSKAAEAVLEEPHPQDVEGFGTYWARQFAEIGLTEKELGIFNDTLEEVRRQPQRSPIDFGE